MKRRWLRRVVLIAALLLLVVVAGSVWAAHVIGSRVTAKNHVPHPDAVPQVTDTPIKGELQLENHTCGYLALAAVYRAFGLDPEREQLRKRLGTDTPAHPFDAASTGTLHPDILRVVTQDNFGYQIVDLASPALMAAVRNHLEQGHPLLTLIVRPQSGGLHWVVIDGEQDGSFRVIDSLHQEVQQLSVEPFIHDQVVSMLALAPAGVLPVSQQPQVDGVHEMRQVAERLRK